MEIKKDAFAVFDCRTERWCDGAALDKHLLRCGHQREFVFFAYDDDLGGGIVAAAENPLEAASRLCAENMVVPTSLTVMTLALNDDQVGMLEDDMLDEDTEGDIEHGIREFITPDMFMKNILRMFGTMISTVNGMRNGAPDGATVTFSCNGAECSADVYVKPDVEEVAEMLEVVGVSRNSFEDRMRHCFTEGNKDLVCASANPMFVKLADSDEEDLESASPTRLMSEVLAMKRAVQIEHENQAVNNHCALMAMGVLVEGTAEEAVKRGDILMKFVENPKPHLIKGRYMAGSSDVEVVLKHPVMEMPPLFSPDYFVDRFNKEFPDAEPTDAEEVHDVMAWLGMVGYYDFYPDDPHILCAATGTIATLVFVKRSKDGTIENANIGFFLTPLGVMEVLKAIVKLRFLVESRPILEAAANTVKRSLEIDALADRYAEVFGAVLGDYLVEVAEQAVKGDKFHSVGEIQSDDGDESVPDDNKMLHITSGMPINNQDDIDFGDIGGISDSTG